MVTANTDANIPVQLDAATLARAVATAWLVPRDAIRQSDHNYSLG